MRPVSIHVDPDHRELSLDPRSRLNFGKVYTIDYGVKVKSIGTVSRTSMRGLVYQFRDVWKFREQEHLDSLKASDRNLPNDVSRPTPDSPRNAKPSLSNEASSVVEILISRGHSVDQILSAFDGKLFNQDPIFGIGSSDGLD